MGPVTIAAIDALLPQTQCGKCGHPGCRPYAEGMAAGEAINKCPPGGQLTVQALARLLQRPAQPLEQTEVPPQIAFIREAECIGCTKCIQACPVDAIVGAAKLMHTVIRDECTGCELCVAPCPVDCIDIRPLNPCEASAQRERADQFRRRYEARQARLARDEARRNAERTRRRPSIAAVAPVVGEDDTHKRLKIEAAMAKVVLGKAEKQYAQHQTAELRQQVETLRLAAEQAQRALDAVAQAQVRLPTAADEAAALKQAKIQLAMRRAELAKAQRTGADALRLDALRSAVVEAEQRLTGGTGRVESAAAPGGSATLRALKSELAYARAALKQLERRQPHDEAALAAARLRLTEAQRQLDDQSAP